MLKLNNIEINNIKQCNNYIKNNTIKIVIDINNEIEKYYKINYNINDKVFFLNTIKNYLYKKDTFSLFINSNDINKLFDIDRLEKFIQYVTNNNKDRVSDEYLLLRYGFINKTDREKRNLSKESYIKKHGDKIGLEKYNNNKNKQKEISKRSLKYWLNLYNDENIAKQKLKEYQQSHVKTHFLDKSDEYIEQYNKKNSPWNVEFYLNKGYTFEEAKSIISLHKRDSSIFCIEHYLNRGYTEKDGYNLITQNWIKYCSNNLFKSTSKASLKQFKEILKYLEQYVNICIYYGDKENNKKEYFIYDKENKQYYFYDLTILYGDIKLIIEYHGHKFHPRKDKLTINEWNNWKCLFNESLTANIKYKQDQYKKQLSINNGFKYLEIWDNDNFIENNNKIKQFIKENLKTN